jgi:uncharacterized phage protein (predicted DNA packaging)
MAFATLEELKAQARIDFDDEDALLQSYLDAATIYVTGFLDDASIPVTGDPASEDVKQATLLIAAAWYDNRATIVGTSSQSQMPQEIPYGARELLTQLRGWCFG